MSEQAEPIRVVVPLLNPNEPEALVSGLPVSNGDAVTTGQALCVLETTKASQELTAPGDGYVSGLRVQVGSTILAGETLLWLSGQADWAPADVQQDPGTAGQFGLRMTEPARALAAGHGLDWSDLPSGSLVTEDMVQAQLVRQKGNLDLLRTDYADGDLVIFGAGGHGASVLELVLAAQAGEVVGFLDDGMLPGEEVLGVPVLGGRGILAELARRGLRNAINAVGGIGDLNSRVKVFEVLERAHLSSPSVHHPSAVIEASAALESGVQVFPHAYIGSRAEIGFGSIVNTAAVVSHDCQLGRVVNVSPGSLLAGGVIVEDRVLIGMGVTINLNVVVGQGARIGNGAVIKAGVPAGAVVKAGSVWPSE